LLLRQVNALIKAVKEKGDAINVRLTVLKERLLVLQHEVSIATARLKALVKATPQPLPAGWEVRVDPATCQVYFVDHKRQKTQRTPLTAGQLLGTDGADMIPVESMPEYIIYAGQLTKAIEEYESVRMEGSRLQ
jgi:hypothetical protein